MLMSRIKAKKAQELGISQLSVSPFGTATQSSGVPKAIWSILHASGIYWYIQTMHLVCGWWHVPSCNGVLCPVCKEAPVYIPSRFACCRLPQHINLPLTGRSSISRGQGCPLILDLSSPPGRGRRFVSFFLPLPCDKQHWRYEEMNPSQRCDSYI